jgi:hypothetical protein
METQDSGSTIPKQDADLQAKEVIITFDIASGKIKSVTDEFSRPAIEKPIDELMLSLEKDKKIKYIPDHTVIRTHSSPDCFTYVLNGVAYTICM